MPVEPATAVAADPFLLYREAVVRLRESVPRIHELLFPNDRPDRLDGWTAMCRRHDAFEQQGGEPVVVATLYGPTGAGKSTLFRLLTGIPVPAGSDVRPVSYASVVVVPPRLDGGPGLSALLPEFRLEPLQDADAVRKPGHRGKVFYRATPSSDGVGGPALVLADVPDFNSVEEENWKACQRMLERAEIVVFVTHSEGYADRRTFTELARCCRLSARLVYLLTKVTDATAARKIWQDLIGAKIDEGNGRHAEAFREQRSDGQPLHAFLGGSSVYYSPYSAAPRLEDVRPLVDGGPSLSALLRGLDAQQLVLRGLLEPAHRAATACRQLVGEARQKMAALEQGLAAVSGETEQAAAEVAGSAFPIGRTLEIVLDEIRSRQSLISRVLSFPFRMIGGIKKRVVGFFSWIRNLHQDPATQTRDALERRRIDEAADWLTDRWRGRFPGECEEGGLLTLAGCQQARDHYQGYALPAPERDWEKEVRTAVQEWAKEHWVRVRMLPHYDTISTIGIGVLVVDLFVTGGVFGSAAVGLGVAGAAAGGAAAAAKILQMAEEMQLKGVFLKADEAWRKQRSRELGDHLQLHLTDPVFRPWMDLLAQLQAAPCTIAADACDTIDLLARSLVTTA